MSKDSSQQFTNYKGETVNPYPKDPDEGYPRAQFKFDRNNKEHMNLLTGTDYSPKGQADHKSAKLHAGGELSVRAEGPRTQPSGKGHPKTKAVETTVKAPKKKTTKAPVKKAVAPKKSVPYWKGAPSSDMTPEAKEAWKKKNGLT